MEGNERRVWKADPATIMVVVGPWVIISLINFLAAFKSRSMLTALGISLGLSLFAALWVMTFRVEIDGKRLSYVSLFSGTRVVTFDQIQSAVIKVGGSSFREKFLPLIRLEITVEPDSGLRNFSINLKVFARGAGSEIVDAVLSSSGPNTKNLGT